MFSSINLTDILERSAWTFVQAFVGVFAIANLNDVASLKAAAVAATAAGISAVLSLLKNLIKQKVETWKKGSLHRKR